MLTFTNATVSEIPILRKLAHCIWHAYYPGIITVEQIDYMLGRFFSPEALQADLAAGSIWELACVDGRDIGFLAVVPEPDRRRLKLSKLYLLPDQHGRGLGQLLLDRVKLIATGLGAEEIYLTVNKQNARAIRAYVRAGFAVAEAVTVDIGQGYVMDDLVMKFTRADRSLPSKR